MTPREFSMTQTVSAHLGESLGTDFFSVREQFTGEQWSHFVTVRRFVEAELRPHAADWEEARWFPNQVFERLASLGYLGLKFPPEYGGDGDPVADAVFVEELSRCGSGGLAAGIGAHSQSRRLRP